MLAGGWILGAKGRAVGSSGLQARKASLAIRQGRSRAGGRGIQGAMLGGGVGWGWGVRLSRRDAFYFTFLPAQQTGF